MAALLNCKVVNPTTPTLLFLHGYLDNASSFETLIPLLDDFQCIAVDLAGHGKSEHRTSGAHYHLADYAYDIYQLVRTLKLTNFIVVGHSLGGIVGSIYAASQSGIPEHIAGVDEGVGLLGFIAIESCGPLAEDAETTAKQLNQSFLSRDKALTIIKHPKSVEAVVKARCAISDLSAIQAKQIMQRNVNFNKEGILQWRTDKRLRTASPMRMTEEQACSVLGSIKCKRALILGKQGFEKVKLAINKRHLVFNDVPLSTFKGGHHVHLDAPVDVAQCISKHSNEFFKY